MAAFGVALFQDAAAKPVQGRQTVMTLKSEMEVIHEEYGVNFVYDSSLDLDRPYDGIPVAKIIRDFRGDDEKALEECLKALFRGTDIQYEVMKKYIVLTRKDGKGKAKDYAIFIEEQRDTLSESLVTVHGDRRRNATQTGLTRMDASKFKKGFATLSSPDVIKEIQTLPGVAGGTELLSGMYVRGGDGKDNLFMLDGIPMYQVSHLAGLFSAFNPEVIENMDFYKSGFPARYGGKLSSVADITTRKGNLHDYKGSFNIGLFHGGLQFEGPVVPGKTSFNVAMRRSWFDVLTIPAMAIMNAALEYGEKRDLRYAMTDLNASLFHMFDKDSELSLNIYTGTDVINYVGDLKVVEYWEGERFTYDLKDHMNARWGNILAGLNWKKAFTDDLHLNTSLYYTRSRNKVGVLYSKWEMDDYVPSFMETVNEELNSSMLHDFGARADMDWFITGNHHFRAGTSYVVHLFRSDKEASFRSTSTGNPVNENKDFYSKGYDAHEVSVYAEDEITLTKWLKANAGLRYSAFNAGEGFFHSLEPRAAFRVQIGPDVSFKASYTEMSQNVNIVAAHFIDIPMTSWLPSTLRVPPKRSRQLAGGVYVTLPHNLVLNVEGYYKTLDNIYEYDGRHTLFPDISNWESELIVGKGRSYGAEMEFAYRTAETEVAAYYTLSWTERLMSRIWPEWYPARNDNRHKVTVVANHKFSRKFDMSLSWNYHSGDRITVEDQYFGYESFASSPNNFKLPDYHRLDVGFNFHKITKRGNESIWNLSVYNIYCRMNPLMAYTDRSDGKYDIVTLSVVPILPSFSYTLRF